MKCRAVLKVFGGSTRADVLEDIELDEITNHKRFIVDIENLPASFPTHRHSAAFWENLGRTVATFGFLEEVLGKAIFAFIADNPLPGEQKPKLLSKNGCRRLKEPCLTSLGG
jgi:hypothetical protein